MWKLGALWKARLSKVRFACDFLGAFDFLRSACSLGIPLENPSNWTKSLILINAPYRSTCLYNAPSLHTVEFRLKSPILVDVWFWKCLLFLVQKKVGNGANTVSGSTVSNTELSEFFGAHRVPGSELSEFLSAYYLCAKANSPSFSQNSPSLPRNSVSSLLWNSTLETVFRPFPKKRLRLMLQTRDF